MRTETVKEIAPAKVNLTLSVGRKRPDGYHDLVTLMETVSLCDELTVSVENEFLPGVKLSISGDYPVPEDPSNLVVRAAEAFFGAFGSRFPISVSLIKRIPTEAGLGGGSADAAAMLRALNAIVDRPLANDALLSVAAKLGADVAFCLFGGTAICSGIGDRISPIDRPAHRFYTIVMGNDRVSTPNAYRSLDSVRENTEKSVSLPSSETLVSVAEGKELHLFNDFEDVVFPTYPAIAARKNRLLERGATAAQLTGSGAAVFGIFPDAESAARAAASFDCDSFAVETVGRYEH